MKNLATWNTSSGEIKATFSEGLGLAIWHNGRLAGCALTVERAQELANNLAGETIWAN